jgi:ligand-binding sensor domain-containing protein
MILVRDDSVRGSAAKMLVRLFLSLGACFRAAAGRLAAGRHATGRLNLLRSLLVCVLFRAATSARAVDPDRHISQYAHSAWTAQDGVFGGSPTVVAQTADGYIWIGTNTGLVRFDGVRFLQWNPPAGTRLLDPRVFSLLGARDGSLWIGTGYSISHWKSGELVNYPQLSGRIEALVEDSEGAIWLARTQPTDGLGPVCSIKDEKLRCYGVSDDIPFPLATHLSKGSAGELWIGGYSQLSRWKPGSNAGSPNSAASKPESLITYPMGTSSRLQPGTFASLTAIATGSNGDVWAAVQQSGTFLQLRHFEHESWSTRSFPEIKVNNADVTALFVDRNDALWIGTAHHGIFRARGSDVDHFGRADGLSSDTVTNFYQDREGTVWAVTGEGLDNFRDLKVVTYSMREGLSGAQASAVLAARDNTVWIANFEALDFERDSRLSAIRTGHGLPGEKVTTFFEDHAGLLWVGVDSGLWVYNGHTEGGTFREVRHPDGSSLGIIFAITEDIHRNIWVRAGTHLDRIHDLELQEELTSPQISTAFTLAANPRGGVVLGLVNGDLLQYEEGKTQTVASNEVGNTRQIRDLLPEPDGSVWGTTLDEVARWKDGTRKNLTTRNGLPCAGIFALVKDQRDSLWLYAQCGLIEIERSQLDLWWQHPDAQVKFTLFDALDGVHAGLTSLKPQATHSPDGRLWFVNGSNLQMIDPNHLQRNALPPTVHMEEVIADRTSYSPQQGLRLPALTRDLEFEYTGLSFVAAQKVRFRYKLEGHDSVWQDPGTRRQAFYSDLGPGKYRFRVMACNNDGVWNDVGDTMSFTIAPAWFQTTWFLVLCIALALFSIWAFYRIRVRQIAKTIGARFDERLAERTRIARDLHDTFLQTIQGSKLVADAALKRSAEPARMRGALEQISAWLERATEEGRTALNSLRTSTTEANDLAEAFRRATEECRIECSIEASVSVVGAPREMHPIVRDEVYRIGYEAIRNACVHSQANQLQVTLTYAEELGMRVADDGVGIDPLVAVRGKEGHFGLPGMRERAARIAGKLTVTSSPASGTEVKLVVPGKIIFRKKVSNRERPGTES